MRLILTNDRAASRDLDGNILIWDLTKAIEDNYAFDEYEKILVRRVKSVSRTLRETNLRWPNDWLKLQRRMLPPNLTCAAQIRGLTLLHSSLKTGEQKHLATKYMYM